MTPRLKWWLPSAACGAALAGNAALQAYHEAWTTAFLSACFGLVIVVDRATSRSMFHLGWTRGFEDGVTVDDDLAQGRPPTVILRRRVTGSLAPEPWDDEPRPTPPEDRRSDPHGS